MGVHLKPADVENEMNAMVDAFNHASHKFNTQVSHHLDPSNFMFTGLYISVSNIKVIPHLSKLNGLPNFICQSLCLFRLVGLYFDTDERPRR